MKNATEEGKRLFGPGVVQDVDDNMRGVPVEDKDVGFKVFQTAFDDELHKVLHGTEIHWWVHYGPSSRGVAGTGRAGLHTHSTRACWSL